MDQRVHFITFSTPDLDAARNFYQAGLGWQPLLDVPGEIIFFQIAPGLVLGLFEAGKFDQDLGRPFQGGAASGVTLAHNVSSASDVDATVGRLVAAGASVVKAPQAGAFGGVYHGLVTDPNGIVWEIAHNPGWQVADDGSVSLG